MKEIEGISHIDGFTLVRTCWACPEQYDVKLGGIQVAYLRLRHGWFYAAVPDVGGYVVFEADDMDGDGEFGTDERERYLNAAIAAVKAYILAKLSPPELADGSE